MAAKVTKKRKMFTLRAPDARSVCLAGTFNDWGADVRPLKLGNDGVWKTSVTLAEGVYEYRYVVDGEWCDDPRCDERSLNEYGSANCLMRV